MSQLDIQDKNYNLENSRTGDLYGQIQAEWSTFMARAMAVHVPGYKYLVNIRGMSANGNVSGRFEFGPHCITLLMLNMLLTAAMSGT